MELEVRRESEVFRRNCEHKCKSLGGPKRWSGGSNGHAQKNAKRLGSGEDWWGIEEWKEETFYKEEA